MVLGNQKCAVVPEIKPFNFNGIRSSSVKIDKVIRTCELVSWGTDRGNISFDQTLIVCRWCDLAISFLVHIVTKVVFGKGWPAPILVHHLKDMGQHSFGRARRVIPYILLQAINVIRLVTEVPPRYRVLTQP
jgi:hypothetical protein